MIFILISLFGAGIGAVDDAAETPEGMGNLLGGCLVIIVLLLIVAGISAIMAAHGVYSHPVQ